MKKVMACLLVTVFLLGNVSVVSAQQYTGRGGFMGFIAGCCFGIRTAAAYNDGKEVHWRQWCRLIPYAHIIFYIWDGIDGANGVTTKDYATQYGAIYY
jgi:hypothetical protein